MVGMARYRHYDLIPALRFLCRHGDAMMSCCRYHIASTIENEMGADNAGGNAAPFDSKRSRISRTLSLVPPHIILSAIYRRLRREQDEAMSPLSRQSFVLSRPAAENAHRQRKPPASSLNLVTRGGRLARKCEKAERNQ